MTSEELNQIVQARAIRLSQAMRRALHMVLVEKHTWRHAAVTCGVTESGILRARRRYGL